MRVLSLDSATESASCAVVENEKVLGEITFNYKKQHSVILMPIIDSLLRNLNLELNCIDGFVVSKGPGSFTGLRIGAATIKALSHGTEKPFIGISSLDALAYNLAYTPGIICPILDALRNNVYTSLFKFDKDNLVSLTDYTLVSIDNLISILKEKNEDVTFIGDAVPKFKDILIKNIENVNFAPPHLNLVKASSLGEIGLKFLEKGLKDDLFNFAPSYIRKSQAEREYEKKMGIHNNE